jgi:hypothetical protein
MSPEAVATALNSTLADGGPDGNYALQSLAEGVSGFTSLDGIGFLGQVHHMTAGPAHYNDTVNFLIKPSGDNSEITAFSMSLIGGALGDAGQGYKNIIMALKGANFNGFDAAAISNLGGSCPPPASTAAPALNEVDDLTQRRRLADSTATTTTTTTTAMDVTTTMDVTTAMDVTTTMDVTTAMMTTTAMNVTTTMTTTAAPVVGSCGASSPSSVPNCLNMDLGSCGNACCSLQVTLSMPAREAVQRLNSSFNTGGPDGDFTKQRMAEGDLGFANLTGKGIPGFGSGDLYIGQVHHMTSGPAHYNDTVNVNIQDGADGAIINAFSTSLIGGAYGDNGQNYKNLMMFLSVFGDAKNVTPGKFALSCPAPSLLI